MSTDTSTHPGEGERRQELEFRAFASARDADPAEPTAETELSLPRFSAGDEAEQQDSVRVEAIGLLAAGLAHDFNNLLSVILSCSDEIAGDETGTVHAERAAEIRDAAERGAELVKRLIDHTREEESAPVAPIDINEQIRDSTSLIARTVGSRVKLRSDLGSGLPSIVLQPTEVEQILLNLAANSRDAMPNGGSLSLRTRLVSIGAEDRMLGTGWFVRLSVTDTGSGMAPSVAERAMQPYFTTKAPERGTGLGLATIQTIAVAAGGDVRISSGREGGCTVSVYLPAVRANGAPLSLQSRAPWAQSD